MIACCCMFPHACGGSACFSFPLKRHKCIMCTFLSLRVQSMFLGILLEFSGKFPDCHCAGLESGDAVTKAPAVSAIIPSASALHCLPIKGTLITGSSAGKRAASWEVSREKVGQACLCRTSPRPLKHLLEFSFFKQRN